MTIIELVHGKKVIRELSQSEVEERVDLNYAEKRTKEARYERNKRLLSCDWTQVPDAPVDQAAWKNYRQELRDVPKQPGFPGTIVWPAPPDE